ncbi:MAG: glycosyltransferase family 2 protein [candidate division NC10 bacterium]|nr:glycosyltransferase family 2 protein [candidate division NC10 bacterium]
MRSSVSVAIIALNEEKKIRACLESVRWANEIVLCDSGSEDRTLESAREQGARIYQDAWRGFSGHKNLALTRCTHPWALVLDADERVTPALQEEIERILGDPEALDGYLIPRRNYFLGQWVSRCGWYPDESIRLFRRDRGRFAERAVHEAVVVDGRVGRLTAPLDHFTYDSIGDYLRRMDRYSTLAAEELRRGGRSVCLFDLIGRPAWTFVRMLLVQRGWREGWRGVILSGLYACYVFSKYAKLWELRDAGRGPRGASHEPRAESGEPKGKSREPGATSRETRDERRGVGA